MVVLALRSRTKAVSKKLRPMSSRTMFVNTTFVPSPEMSKATFRPRSGSPSSVTLTGVSAPVVRSLRNTCEAPNRLVVSIAVVNTTKRPFGEMRPAFDARGSWAPSDSTLIRWVVPVAGVQALARSAVATIPAGTKAATRRRLRRRCGRWGFAVVRVVDMMGSSRCRFDQWA